VLRRLDRDLSAGGRWTGTYDMLPAAYTLYPELERHTAEHLKQEVVGIETDTAHRALSDCMDQQSILKAMQRRRARRDRVVRHEPLLPLLLAALTYERPEEPDVPTDMEALMRVGLTWALRDASPASDDLEAVLPRALPDRFRKTGLYNSIDETQLIEEATGIEPGLKRRLGALFEPFADRVLRGEGLGKLLTHLTLWGENQEVPGKEVVSLSTYHSAKGLEFEKVVCMDAHNNAFPPFFARDPEERRESRRLLYVGMTRAENELLLTYPKVERGYERSPTPFLKPFTTEPGRTGPNGHGGEAITLTP
jgi:Superfamily I DNA and RNA helicases